MELSTIKCAIQYEPPPGFKNPHLQTIFPALFRWVRGVDFEPERIETDDDDFLDLAWIRQGSDRVAILTHGLEGSAQRSYVRGMARTLAGAGWDVLAWNLRGCGGTPNRLLAAYHAGFTDDLERVVQHALGQGYSQVGLVGFSLGGNLTLKYLGERSAALDERLVGAVAFSTPCDLAAGAAHIDGAGRGIYRRYFIRSLHARAREKMNRFPDALPPDALTDITSLVDFDDRFTAPLHGFDGAEDYYRRSSCLPFLPDIRLPALLVNAADDPFLPKACYPVEIARRHDYFQLEVPRYGGHVGFVAFNHEGIYWSEWRAATFLTKLVGRL